MNFFQIWRVLLISRINFFNLASRLAHRSAKTRRGGIALAQLKTLARGFGTIDEVTCAIAASAQRVICAR
jgi:hypothetical protein